MKPITFHSNYRKDLQAVLNWVAERGFINASESYICCRYRVSWSVGARVTQDAATDYKFHEAVMIPIADLPIKLR